MASGEAGPGPGRQDRRRAERVRADWTARLATADGVVEGRVIDLSAVSVRVRPEPPATLAAGTPVTLTVAFPGPENRFEVLTLAASVVRAGVDGIALAFSGLPDQASRWLRARLLTTESRRRSPRLRIALAVEIRREGAEPAAAQTVDLSAFGARVETALSLVPGDRLDLRLPLDPARPPLRIPSVVWEVDGPSAVLVFTNLPPADFNRLGDYVATRLGPRG